MAVSGAVIKPYRGVSEEFGCDDGKGRGRADNALGALQTLLIQWPAVHLSLREPPGIEGNQSPSSTRPARKCLILMKLHQTLMN